MTAEKYDLQDVLDAVMLDYFVAWSEGEMWKHLTDPVEIDDKSITERAVKRTLAKLRRHERIRS